MDRDERFFESVSALSGDALLALRSTHSDPWRAMVVARELAARAPHSDTLRREAAAAEAAQARACLARIAEYTRDW